MKIALVNQPLMSGTPPQTIRGSIVAWTYHAARLLARTNPVIVYTPKADRYFQPESYLDKDVEYRYIPLAIEKQTLKQYQRLLNKVKKVFPQLDNPKQPFFASGLFYPLYAWQIAADLKRRQCDVVHIHNFSQFVPIVRALNPKIKIVLHMHCDWLIQLDPAIVERRLRHVDAIVGCSHYITAGIQKQFPHYAERCKTVYNGVDIERFTPQSDSHNKPEDRCKKLLFVGRVSPEKGIHILLQAFEQVLQVYPDVRLEIVGSQKPLPYKYIVALGNDPLVSKLNAFYPDKWSSYLSDWQQSSQAAEEVSFVGGIPHLQLANYFRGADIFVHPSVWGEPFPLTVLEAMATGLPAILTQVGGLPESIEEGRTGLLVKPDDADALASAILQLLRDEDTRTSMGQLAHQRVVERFSLEGVMEDLMQEYRQLV